ncbi:hypothetical protein QAD02_000467 [Eretmocerus hayati]|uniref:Uncharacterized protein n=1 Tax=Eretmocerus hayati TaxID=131215 RepID=A0ACC2NE43_9HYME|nr:hypothetical protein QAD02_000467 [Eretmocerus hayati]
MHRFIFFNPDHVADYEQWLRDEKLQLREVLNDDAYMEVQVFQKYIIPKLDMGSMWSAVFDTCLKFKGAKSDCTSIHCRRESEQKRCKGVLFNCAEISGIADVCYAPLSSERRYNWMKIDESKIFVRNDSCLTVQRVAPEFRSGLCMCDCEYVEGNMNRHFSLGEALSSLSDNEIIIGARLVLRCHVFHIQIKQGKLREYGFVDDDTEWVEIDEVSQSSSSSDLTADKMLHTVTWNRDTIIVGTIMGNPNMILTGLRFGVINGKLELLIRLTAFDFETGKLNESITGWSSLDRDAREDAKFMTTNLRSDLGQRTMPLLNKLDVVVDPVTPLIGAGLFVYEDPKRVQYLGLQLIHHSLDMFSWKYLHPPSY